MQCLFNLNNRELLNATESRSHLACHRVLLHTQHISAATYKYGVTQCYRVPLHTQQCHRVLLHTQLIFISPVIMQFRGFSSNLMKWNFCSDTEFLLFRLLVKGYEISCATQVRCLVNCRSDNNFKLTGKWNYRSISNAGSQAYSMISFPKCE